MRVVGAGSGCGRRGATEDGIVAFGGAQKRCARVHTRRCRANRCVFFFGGLILTIQGKKNQRNWSDGAERTDESVSFG